MKSKFKVILLLIFMVCTAGTIFSAGDVDGIFDAMERNVVKMSDMTANINQTIFMMGQNIISSGKMSMKKPHLMKMDMISPQKQVIVMNGEEKMMYIKMETGQIMKQKMPDSGAANNINFNFDRESLGKGYTLNVIEESKGIAVVEFVPKSEGNTMKFTLTIDTEKGVIMKNVVKDEKNGIDMVIEFSDYEKIAGKYWMAKTITTTSKMGGNNMKTIMKYSNIKINQNLKDEEFEI